MRIPVKDEWEFKDLAVRVMVGRLQNPHIHPSSWWAAAHKAAASLRHNPTAWNKIRRPVDRIEIMFSDCILAELP